MRKITAILLAAILCVSLAACGGNEDIPAPTVIDGETSTPTASNSPENDASNEEMPTTYDAEAIKEEADALWQTFLETIVPIETDSKYASILKIVNNTAVSQSNYYEKATGNSKDEYLEMSTFEQFLWYSTYDAEAIKEDADEVWNTFMDSVSLMETDSKYATIMNYYNKDTFARNYANYCGGTEEDYLNLTDFERFVLYTTYVIPVMATQYSDYDTYFGSIAKWNSNVAGSPYNFLNNQYDYPTGT